MKVVPVRKQQGHMQQKDPSRSGIRGFGSQQIISVQNERSRVIKAEVRLHWMGK